MNTARILASIACSLLISSCGSGDADSSKFDLAITGARIVDGTGGPSYKGSILVRGGRIAQIVRGEEPVPAAKQTIEAGGRVVSPGFIDSHAHGDPLTDKTLVNFVSQGVTTVALGQDGTSPGFTPSSPRKSWLTLADWMRRTEQRGLELNVASLSGHSTLREQAGVGSAPQPTPQQLERMRALLKADLDAGAFGMSSGLEYPLGIYSSTGELVEMAKVVGAANGVVLSHLRSEDDDKIEGALDELLQQGKFARVHFSHMKVVLGQGAPRARQILDRMRAAGAQGSRVSGDVYPYTAGAARISLIYPTWAKTPEQFAEAMRTRRAELEEAVRKKIESRKGPERILIGGGQYAGKNLKQAADMAGKPYWNFALEEFGIAGPLCAFFVMDEALQDAFVTSDLTAISSDGGPVPGHPRSWATYARIIEDYVGKRRLLSLEQAVHKMTWKAAEAIGIPDRGRIAPGMAADLVIFAPERVKARATWAESTLMSEGFDQVFVNGALAFQKGAMTGARPGKILRRAGEARK